MIDDFKTLTENEIDLFMEYVDTRISCITNDSNLDVKSKIFMVGLLIGLANSGVQNIANSSYAKV